MTFQPHPRLFSFMHHIHHASYINGVLSTVEIPSCLYVEMAATTLVAVSGKKSPEYKAIQKTIGEITRVLRLDAETASQKLFGADLIPSLEVANAASMLQSVLNHVEFDAMHFYSFLNAVQSLNNSSAVLNNIQNAFVGKNHQLL